MLYAQFRTPPSKAEGPMSPNTTCADTQLSCFTNPDTCVTFSDSNVNNHEILQRRFGTLMESHPLSRHFEFNGPRLPDIDPNLRPDEIRILYSHQYPDIATASITGPQAVGDKLVYRFTRAIGSKGWGWNLNKSSSKDPKDPSPTRVWSCICNCFVWTQ
jgi:PRTRC genetic system protein C